MPRSITIDPVTRIEGHAKITVHLDKSGSVSDARFHVAEFRGFEKFCEGRPFWEMAGLTARICGICPVSHLIASSKAGDAILSVQVPPPAEKLRRLMNLGQIVQSHALSFFHLSAPDLLLGFDSDPARRNVFGLIAEHPEIARAGILLRQFGQEIIERLGGRKIHPSWTVPGGVRERLSTEHRDAIASRLPQAFSYATTALDLWKNLSDHFPDEADSFGNFPSLFLALVGDDGTWEHYGGAIRVIDAHGQLLVNGFPPEQYPNYVAEAVEPDSYLKSPYFRPLGYPDGLYRVGPLARLNLCQRMGTPRADAELLEFRQRYGSPATSSLWYHPARLIEILCCLELVEQLLDDPDLLSDHLRARASVNRPVGIGISEAPRGTLFHHYEVDRDGKLTYVNLIIATGQNNLAMNRTVLQIARHYIHGESVSEGVLNRIEAGIRAFDPCLSCSTHAAGQMPLVLQIFSSDGLLLKQIHRE